MHLIYTSYGQNKHCKACLIKHLMKLVIEVGVLVLVEFVEQVGDEVLDESAELVEIMNQIDNGVLSSQQFCSSSGVAKNRLSTLSIEVNGDLVNREKFGFLAENPPNFCGL